MESLKTVSEIRSEPRSIPAAVSEALMEKEVSDKGLYIVVRNRNSGDLEFYSICDTKPSRIHLPQFHIDTDDINIHSLKLFPCNDYIYVTHLIRNQRLEIKSWNFKSQDLEDVMLPSTVQFLRPRITNVFGDAVLIMEEKYVTWPHEFHKTIAYKFGLKSEYYRSIEFNCENVIEIACLGDEVFAFSGQKTDVWSFDLNMGKRTSRGTLNSNGAVKAVVYRGNLYIASFVRARCTLFIEQYNEKTNRWNIVSAKYLVI